MKKISKTTLQSWIFIIPSVILIALFVFYPMIQAFILSFQNNTGSDFFFVGFKNYQRLLTDTTFHKALLNTIIFLLIQVPIMLILALIISNMLNNPRLKFKGIFRTAIFLPCVTSLVAYSIIFKSLFANDGFINVFLVNTGILNTPIDWITDPFWAKVLIIISITWRWTGYNMIFYLAGLQGIDSSVYEAADIDGASTFAKFRFITLPSLKPIILFTAINSTIGTLQLFDETMNITKGGPANSTLTVSNYIYNIMFKFNPNFGYAAAVSYVIVLLIVVLSLIQLRVGKDD